MKVTKSLLITLSGSINTEEWVPLRGAEGLSWLPMRASESHCPKCHQPRPKRPSSFDVAETQFARKAAIRWHSPKTLARAGSHALMFKIVGGFSDQRDTQRFLSSAIVEVQRPCSGPGGQPSDEIWFDYFADSGDGFDACATVAYLLAQETVDLAHPVKSTPGDSPAEERPVRTRRGSLLIHGGDAVYPVARTRAYEDRFTGPMRAMLDHTCDEHPILVGIPGNHDWMDGLNSWSKIMTQKGWVGGWRTAQERSYFASKLSEHWWMLGVDAHLGEYLDEGQIEFFKETAASFAPGTQVILCVPTPTWIHQSRHSEAHQVLDYLIRKSLKGRAEVRLVLTGDLHHYSRYEAEPASNTHLITAGGGGAFLSASHWLPPEIVLPAAESRDQGKSDPVQFEQRCVYPSAVQSKAVGRRWPSILWRNGGFPLIIGVLYLALGWNVLGASPDSLSTEALWSGLFRPGTVFWLAVSFVFCLLAAKSKAAKAWVVAVPHLGLHILSLSVLATLSRFLFENLDASFRVSRYLGSWFVAGTGAILGTLVSSFAFFLADRRGLDHLFLSSGIRSTQYRNFIRMRLDAEETLTVFPIGIDESPKDWAANSDGEGSWFQPDRPIQPHLIEDPIVIPLCPNERLG